MEAAKNAVSKHLTRDGKHDTHVHETFAPSVTSETVNPHRHENVTTAVDREVHQDHYHTTVQPVHDKQTLPEQHHHNLAGVEHRKFEHGNDEHDRSRIATEKAKFKDTSVRGDTTHTNVTAPTVHGEHVHHHVHENIQPVIHRETVEPHVVHTTVPIHETHHNAAQHHAATSLPAVSLADFKKGGGVLQGREERHDHFAGEPRGMIAHAPKHTGNTTDHFRETGHVDAHGHGRAGAALEGASATGATGTGMTGSHHHNHHHTAGTTGTTGSTGATGTTGTTGTSGLTGSNGLSGTHGTTGTSGPTGSRASGVTGTGTATAGATGTPASSAVAGSGLGSNSASGTHGTGLTGNRDSSGPLNSSRHAPTGTTGHTSGLNSTNSNTSSNYSSPTGRKYEDRSSRADSADLTDDKTTRKPSLLQRLNPMKDSDGDGKRGIMD